MKTIQNIKVSNKSLLKGLKFSILFLIISFCVTTAFSQTLEFSQAKLVSSLETIPSGKVWKITGILSNNYLTSTTGSKSTSGSVSTSITLQSIYINGDEIVYASSHSKGFISTNSSTGAFTSSAATIAGNAIWLPAGTTLEAATGVYAISVIEFTVVP